MSEAEGAPWAVTEALSRDEVEGRARALLGRMSEDDKLAVVSGDTPFWPGVTEMVTAYNTRPWTAGEIPSLGVPGLRFTDGPRGVALGASTCFPVAMARGATWDPALEARVGDVIGVEARAQGANLIGSVCVNLVRHPAWGRSQETFGEDPEHVGAMGEAHTLGVQRHVMACVKHLACNSIETSRYYVDVEVDARALHEVYLPQFKRCIDAGAASVMSAYNKLNGDHCGESRALLTDVLRGAWGFEGFVMSDFLFGLRDGLRAFKAGMDVEMPFRNLFARDLPRALAAGHLDTATLDRAVSRVLRQQLRFAGVGEPSRYAPESVACAAHRDLAREVATRSMVLLQNDPVRGAPLLPLDASRLRRVAVIGRLAAEPNLGDRGSSAVRAAEVITALQGLRDALPRAEVTHDDGRSLAKADASARGADVAVVVVGLTWRDEGEGVSPPLKPELAKAMQLPPAREVRPFVSGLWGARGIGSSGDRVGLGLRPSDVELIRVVAAANPATVVVLVGGSALHVEPWRAAVPAVVMAWYPGMEGGRALADLVLGREDFRGRLPTVWVDDPSWLPPFDPRAERVRYGLLHGQRWVESQGRAARFPLGFGLSYARFARGPTRASRRGDVVEVDVPVENLGDRAGGELVIVRASVEGDAEPSKLAGFARVELAASAREVVRVTVPLERLARYAPSRGGWDLPRGRVRFTAGDGTGEATIKLG